MSGDVHTPTNAGPDPDVAFSAPAADAFAPDAAPADSPEVLVGAAFAGGLLAALILKRLVR